MQTRVQDNPDLHRFEIYADESLAGFAVYEPAGANRAFVHTEIYPRHEGQGLAKILIRDALDATRDEKLGVLPFCPFVHRFVGKNQDYLALVPDWARERLGLPES
ncbi:MAG TPA: GNAT family N-acetyltransferase [Aldersonia sp.]